MDVELEKLMLINRIPNEQMPQLVNSEDDVAAYQQSAYVQNITNPKTTEIQNQPTARDYQYTKQRRGY